MKKFLFGILTFLGIGLSFCSALDITNIEPCTLYTGFVDATEPGPLCLNFYFNDFPPSGFGFFMFGSWNNVNNYADIVRFDRYAGSLYPDVCLRDDDTYFISYYYYDGYGNCSGGGGGSSTPSDITVYYNNSQSNTTITCDGTQAIEIQGLSTITSTNTFTPYFNLDYIDEDNQILTESYSKDILYLSGATFKKTYTGNNIWILTAQGNSESIFSGYVPTFNVTGSVDPNDEFTGNVFNNFADNSLKYLLSNIPSYIQYFIILLILFLILGFVKKFKRK